MSTPQWIKNLGGHAGELYVCAELSKRGIPNVLLPQGFPDSDILVSNRNGTESAYIQVKSCHPDRSSSFLLKDVAESWSGCPENHFCVFVWLGKTLANEPPRYWVAYKKDVGVLCTTHRAHGTDNWERRFYPKDFQREWENHWSLFDIFTCQEQR